VSRLRAEVEQSQGTAQARTAAVVIVVAVVVTAVAIVGRWGRRRWRWIPTLAVAGAAVAVAVGTVPRLGVSDTSSESEPTRPEGTRDDRACGDLLEIDHVKTCDSLAVALVCGSSG
jgi:hypothetical protein